MLLPEIERLGAEVERLRAEIKALRDEAATRDREWRECCFVKDRAMADLAMEIARLRADLERATAGGAR